MPITNNTSHTMTNNRFSGMIETVAMCKQLCFGGSALGLFTKIIEKVLFALFTCILALGKYTFNFLPLNLLLAFS